MAEHAAPTHRSYFFVFVALMALAALSYGISFASLGDATRVPIAVAISLAKALLVAVFFMELIHQRATNRFVLTAALVLVCTLIGLMAADTLTRDTPPMRSSPPAAPAAHASRTNDRAEPPRVFAIG